MSKDCPKVDNQLANYKQECLQRKANTDCQLLTMAQEDLRIHLKRRFVEQMAEVDAAQEKTIGALSTSIQRLTNCISAQFGLLQQLFSIPE